MTISKAYDNVFEAIEDDVSTAGNLKLRGRLMTEIRRFINERGFTQTQAARELGITQPRLSDLMRGHINRFSLDALVNMAATTGADVVIEVKRKTAKAITRATVTLTSPHAASLSIPLVTVYSTLQELSGVAWTGPTDLNRLMLIDPIVQHASTTPGEAVH